MLHTDTRHGYLDHLTGGLLIVAPWPGLAHGGPWVPALLGIGVIAHSLLTDYRVGDAAVALYGRFDDRWKSMMT